MKKNLQAGFGLVEVLISIAVISAVLLGAFAVSQRSAISVRDSQEHSEMTQLLQGQLEYVRSIALAQDSATGGIFASGEFCINTSSPATPIRVPASNTVCKDINRYYDIKIVYNSSSQVFKLTGTWETVTGAKGTEQMSYRVYPTE